MYGGVFINTKKVLNSVLTSLGISMFNMKSHIVSFPHFFQKELKTDFNKKGREKKRYIIQIPVIKSKLVV